MRKVQHKYHDRYTPESPQNLQAKGQSMHEGDDESKSAAKKLFTHHMAPALSDYHWCDD